MARASATVPWQPALCLALANVPEKAEQQRAREWCNGREPLALGFPESNVQQRASMARRALALSCALDAL